MSQTGQTSRTLSTDIFCRVIDNFGDAGVMWRLAKALTDEGLVVRLIIDDIETLSHLTAGLKPIAAISEQYRIEVFHWEKSWDAGECPLEPAAFVIEGFGCRLPANYESKMAQRSPSPLWVNVDYFSAEDWVDDFHMQPSIHPTYGLKKYFVFPGVSTRSGGLIIEKDYEKEEKTWKASHGHCGPLKLFFFTYPYGPIRELAQTLAELNLPIQVRCAATQAGQMLYPNINELNSDRLTAKLLPFVAQESFDHFLWDCDLAFIRGEDSAARAMIAGVPFIWHIYHQEDNAHQVKLQALEKKMSHCFDDTNLFNAWCQFQEGFNNGVVHRDALKIIVERLDSLRQCSMAWRKKIHANGSLAQKLSEMAKKTLK